MAAQLTGTNCFLARCELKWSARATSSLPVPLSPVMSTLAELPDKRRMSANTSCAGADALDAGATSGGDVDAVAFVDQRLREEVAHGGVIVDDEKLRTCSVCPIHFRAMS